MCGFVSQCTRRDRISGCGGAFVRTNKEQERQRRCVQKTIMHDLRTEVRTFPETAPRRRNRVGQVLWTKCCMIERRTTTPKQSLTIQIEVEL